MEIHAGEIVGVAGIEGSGQQELLRVLAGRLAPTAGVVRIPNRIGFVPEDRLRDALVPSMTLAENFALKEAGASHGTLAWRSYEGRAGEVLRKHDVRAAGVHSAAGALSGGNQQKFVFGRELEGLPDALVVENPTRGLDIRAAAHVLAELRSARAAGVAVVTYSSDLDEVLSFADRMIVCFDGRRDCGAARRRAVLRVRWSDSHEPRCAPPALTSGSQHRGRIARAHGRGTVVVMAGGYDIGHAATAMWNGSAGSAYSFFTGTLLRATPLMIVGLAVAVGVPRWRVEYRGRGPAARGGGGHDRGRAGDGELVGRGFRVPFELAAGHGCRAACGLPSLPC